MNVLLDYHQGGLFYSLHLLFEKRLKYKIFRPIGTAWVTNGFWKIAEPYGNAQDTIDQYLGINDRAWDTFKNLNGNYKLQDDIYHVYDPENQFQHKAITFEKFKEMEFDLIIGTYPTHDNWEQLLYYQPKAKFIMQIGNEGQTTDAKNVLCSTNLEPKDGQNFIRYHQEIDLSKYNYVPPTNHTTVKSFVISLPESEQYFAYKNALSEFDFKAHGVSSPDGTVQGTLVSSLMKESAFGYHVKPADGFGHVIFGWGFSGRPLIGNASYYKGKPAEGLWNDGVTSIDLEKHSFEENVTLIREASKPENHLKMCEAMAKRARELIDYDKEAEEIKLFLNTIV